MTYKIGDRVKIVAKSLARKGWQGIIIDVNSTAGAYNVQFTDKTTDWYSEIWLEKVEENTNIPHQPTVPLIPKKEMDWSKIKEFTEMALAHNKDIVITINADGSKEIEISTPTTSIVETNMRTKYVLEDEKKC